MNSVALTGNLATDPELREVGEGKKVVSFVLAVDRPTRDEADFFRISAWDKQAETCARFLSKGRRVGLEGRLRSRSWEDADGKRRSAVEVVAARVEFLDGSGERDGANVIPFEAAAAS